ncbi:hypothetical protein ACYBSK_34685 [Streptomyces sp. BYX5S]
MLASGRHAARTSSQSLTVDRADPAHGPAGSAKRVGGEPRVAAAVRQHLALVTR